MARSVDYLLSVATNVNRVLFVMTRAVSVGLSGAKVKRIVFVMARRVLGFGGKGQQGQVSYGKGCILLSVIKANRIMFAMERGVSIGYSVAKGITGSCSLWQGVRL